MQTDPNQRPRPPFGAFKAPCAAQKHHSCHDVANEDPYWRNVGCRVGITEYHNCSRDSNQSKGRRRIPGHRRLHVRRPRGRESFHIAPIGRSRLDMKRSHSRYVNFLGKDFGVVSQIHNEFRRGCVLGQAQFDCIHEIAELLPRIVERLRKPDAPGPHRYGREDRTR